MISSTLLLIYLVLAARDASLPPEPEPVSPGRPADRAETAQAIDALKHGIDRNA